MHACRRISALVVCLTLGLIWPVNYVDAEDSVGRGAGLYRQYCVLCHGLGGMGEGVLPMALTLYPNTSLMKARFGNSKNAIRDMITACKSDHEVAAECVPFGMELNAQEIDALTDFIIEFRADTAVAFRKVLAASVDIEPTARRGGAVFRVRCAQCHGSSGKGDGRVAHLLTPPPADFTKSAVSDQYIMEIVVNGGASKGRSLSMPIFGETLDDTQIKSIILYLKTLRTISDMPAKLEIQQRKTLKSGSLPG